MMCDKVWQNTSWFSKPFTSFSKIGSWQHCAFFVLSLSFTTVSEHSYFNLRKGRRYAEVEIWTSNSRKLSLRAANKDGRLAQQFGISKSAVTKFLKCWKVQGNCINKKKSGRPHCTASLVDRNILRASRSNPHLTAPDIAKEIWTSGQSNPSIRTIRRRLQAAGLNGRRPKEAIHFCKKSEGTNRMVQSASQLDISAMVLMSSEVYYESKFMFWLFGSDGKMDSSS